MQKNQRIATGGQYFLNKLWVLFLVLLPSVGMTAQDQFCAAAENPDPIPEGVCERRPDSILPALTGPYCVGTTEVRVVDPVRDEPHTSADLKDKRELLLRIWYPVDPHVEGNYAEYMNQESFDWMIKMFFLSRYFTLPKDANDQIKPHALKDAPLAGSTRQFPLILFSPGLFYVSYSYAAFVEDLASHGYVVAVISHPYISGITSFPDGHTVEPVKIADTKKNINVFLKDSFDIMVKDVGTILNRLEVLNSGGNPNPDEQQWVCRIDADKIGMLGHSIGGAVALQQCAQDERFKACVNMDGVPLGSVAEDGTDKPVMILRSVNIFKNKEFKSFWNKLTGDAYSVRIIGSGHTAYTDVGIMLKHFLPYTPRIIFGVGAIDPEKMIALTNRYLLAFFDAYLKNGSTSTISDIKKKNRKAIFKEK